MSKVGPVDGQRLKWAREQQELTLRTVLDRGGPSIGFQSEVERGRKTDVSAKILQTWVKILGVTEAFARGEVPQYPETPAYCRGLAADVVPDILEQPSAWRGMGPLERFRNVLWTIGTKSRKTPRVVLAYALGVELSVLDGLLSGDLVASPALVRAVCDLTSLPESLFYEGAVEEPDLPSRISQYLPALDIAIQSGLSPDEVRDLIRVASRLKEGAESPISHGSRRRMFLTDDSV